MDVMIAGGLRRKARGDNISLALNAAQNGLIARVADDLRPSEQRRLVIGAMEMGTGKTLAALAALCRLRGEALRAGSANPVRALFVVPKSTLHDVWHRQRRAFTQLRPADIKIVTYPQLQRAFLSGWKRQRSDDRRRLEWVREKGSPLLERRWSYLVFDESHILRNPRRMSVLGSAASVVSGRAERVLCLTGTPIHNGPRDASGQLRAMMSGSLLENPSAFGASSTMPQAEAASQFNSRFVYTSSLLDAGVILPPKERVTVWVDHGLDEEGVDTYNECLAKSRRRSTAHDSRHHILAMRQLCNEPALYHKHGRLAFDETARAATVENPGLKLQAAVDLTRRLVFEGHDKIVVVSEFVTLLDTYKELALVHLGENCASFDGRLSAKERCRVVDDFLGSERRVLCLSLHAGAFGLNLVPGPTAMIIVGVWWNPAVHRQVEARIHRIGQNMPVVIHTIVTRDSIEAVMLAAHESKEACAAAMLFSEEFEEKNPSGVIELCKPLVCKV